MKKKNIKEKIAELIVNTAMNKAEKTVGQSLPIGIYEVEVPAELKMNKINEEA